MADSSNGFSMEPFKTLRKSLPKTTRFVGAAHDGGLNSDVHSIGKGVSKWKEVGQLSDCQTKFESHMRLHRAFSVSQNGTV